MRKPEGKNFVLYSNDRKATPVDSILLFILIYTLLFLPFIPVLSDLNLSVEEIVIPLLALRLIQKKVLYLDYLQGVILLLLCAILCSILSNLDQVIYRDFWEIYKQIKFLIIYTFTCFVLRSMDLDKSLVRLIHYSFIVLLLFNMFHFYSFTRDYLALYDSGTIDVNTYGLNSLGDPGPKRFVGTMGNPNYNGFLFLIYYIVFSNYYLIFEKNKYALSALFTLISIVLITMTQSRTCLLILGLIVSGQIAFYQFKWSRIFVYGSLVLVLLFSFLAVNRSSLSYLSGTEFSVKRNTSLNGRIASWKWMHEEWLNKPLLGNGPSKALIYEEEFYPENEYLFILWRYGIIGLLLYVTLIFLPLYLLRHNSYYFRFYGTLLFAILLFNMASAFLSNAKFSIIFALLLGFLSTKAQKVQRG